MRGLLIVFRGYTTLIYDLPNGEFPTLDLKLILLNDMFMVRL